MTFSPSLLSGRGGLFDVVFLVVPKLLPFISASPGKSWVAGPLRENSQRWLVAGSPSGIYVGLVFSRTQWSSLMRSVSICTVMALPSHWPRRKRQMAAVFLADWLSARRHHILWVCLQVLSLFEPISFPFLPAGP